MTVLAYLVLALEDLAWHLSHHADDVPLPDDPQVN